MEILYMIIQGVILIIAVITGIALHDFRKRRHDVFDSVQAKKRHQRTIRKIEITLAGSVIVLALLFVYQPDSPQETQVGNQGVQTDAENKEYPEGVYGPGTYKVGTDIDPGEYRLTADSQNDLAGFYEVKDGSGSESSILSNSLFESNEYVTVNEGEYLTVNRATFELITVNSTSLKSESGETAAGESTEVAAETEPTAYAFENTQAEADYFTAIGLTLENGVTTMQDVAAMSRTCGKLCPDVPAEEWGLQLEAMNSEVYELDRQLYDFALGLSEIPEGGSPNIDFAARDELVRDMETMNELISIIMTKNDWNSWEEGWDTVDEAVRLMEKMYMTNVYTVPAAQ